MNDRPAPTFAGLRPPAVPFSEVRDRRRAIPLYVDVDLTAARSIAGGTPAVLPIAGSFLFIDQDPVNVGTATIRFVDNNSVLDTPITVGPGSNWKVPFTGLVIENAAQAGKRLRIIYGVDVDMVPGVNAQVLITGAVSVIGPHALNVGPLLTDSPILARVVGFTYGATFTSAAALASGASEQVFAAAANPNGAIVWEREADSVPTAAGVVRISLHAHTVAPVALGDGDRLLAILINMATAVGNTSYGRLNNQPVFVPAGKGLWFLNSGGTAEGQSARRVVYTLF